MALVVSLEVSGMTDATIVVPAYNEAEGLGETLARLKEVRETSELEFEVIVVDDGSTDETARIAEDAGVRLLRHKVNRGYGAALKTGIAGASSDKIVIIDADLTYPAERIPELVAGLDEADMAVGARTGTSVEIPFSRRPAKWVLRVLANRVAGRRIPDLNSGLRAVRREMLERYLHLCPDGFSFTTTLTLAGICDGREVVFVPIDYRKRTGKSKIHPIRDTSNFLVLILRTAAYFEPLRVFLPAALLSGVLSSGLLLYYFVKDGGVSDTGVLASVVTILIFMMGILADLVVRRTRR